MRLLFFLVPALLSGQNIQLAPPHFGSEAVFFLDKTVVSLEFDLEGASIHYSLEENPTPQSATYTLPFYIHESGAIKAIACHPDYLASAVAERQFLKAKYRPDSIVLSPAAHASYPGNGAATLCDFKKGGANLHDGNWLGFSGDTLTVESFFSDKIVCNKLIISTLSDLKSWVLPFREVRVFGKGRHGKWKKIGFWKAENEEALINPASKGNFQHIELKPFKARQMKIEIVPFGNLPVGHPGAGSPAWLFLDEIIFQ